MQRKFIEDDILERGYDADVESESEEKVISKSTLRFDAVLAEIEEGVVTEATVRIKKREDYLQLLDVLAKNPPLEKLKLCGVYVGGESLAALGGVLIHNTHLTHLSVKTNIVGTENQGNKFLVLFNFNPHLVNVKARCPHGQEMQHKEFKEKLLVMCQKKMNKSLFFKEKCAEKIAKKEHIYKQKCQGF